MAPPARADPGLNSMKQLGLLVLPHGGSASPVQDYPLSFYYASLTICQYPFILVGEERHCDSKVFFLNNTTQ